MDANSLPTKRRNETMKLLENELLRKYFGDQGNTIMLKCCLDRIGSLDERMALRVLDAMEQPIRTGDRYLGYWFSENTFKEDVAERGNIEPYHPGMLRLPSRFQPTPERSEGPAKKECAHCFCRVDRTCCYCKEKKPTPPPACCDDHNYAEGFCRKKPAEHGCDELRHQMGYQKCPHCPDDKPPLPREVVEKLPVFSLSRIGKVWHCSLMGGDYAVSDAAPMAICLAFLKLNEEKA